MLDIGWWELIVIGIVALLVVGPKELPGLMRTVGQYAGKARRMAREFQRSMEDAAREADLEEVTKLRRDINKMTNIDFSEQAKRTQASLSSGGKPKTKPHGDPMTAAGDGAAKTDGAAKADGAESKAPSPQASAPEAAPAPEPQAEPEPRPRAASGE